MIYSIIAVNPKNGDEWVLSTHDSIHSAMKLITEYREQETGYEYRVDTTEPVARRTLFTTRELFPPHPKGKIPSTNCVECGAYVMITWQVRHVLWHNKVADL